MRLLSCGLLFACLAQTTFCAGASTSREYTGDFVLNREIPVNLAAGTPDHPRLVEVPWVRVEPLYGNAWALTARVGWLSIADATWQIRVELMDDKGNVLRHFLDEPTFFTGEADGSNQAEMRYTEVDLDSMQWEMRKHAAKIRVVLEPAEDPMAGRSERHEIQVSVADGKSGKPIADAVVVANAIHDGGQRRSHTFLYCTDSRGECRVALAKANLVATQVTVQKPGYATLCKSWSSPSVPFMSSHLLAELPERHAVKMPPSQTIGGIVRNQAGEPIAGAQVRVDAYQEEVGGMTRINRAVQTDKDGRWQVEGVAAEALDISLGFKHPEYIGDAWANRRMRAEEIASLGERKHVAKLTRGLPVTGRVLDDQGRPVSRAAVILAPACSYGFRYEYACTLSDADGRFRFDCSDDDRTDTEEDGGSTGVLVEASGFVPALRRVVVEPNLAPLEFRLSPGRALTVRVVDANDRPIANARTATESLLAEDPRYGLWGADTDEQGLVRISHVPDREALLSVFKTGFLTLRDHKLSSSDDEQVVKMKPVPRIRGVVRDARTGEPVKSFAVSLAYEMNGRSETSELLRCMEGRLEMVFDERHPEGLELKILAAGYRPTTYAVRVEGTRTMDVTLTPDPSFDAKALERESGGPQRSEAFVVTGTVVDPNGQPVPNASVSVPSLPVSDVLADAQGRFKLRLPSMMGEAAAQSRYLLVRSRERNLAAVAELDQTAAESLTIKLAPGVVLSGKVADVRGEQVPGLRVFLHFWPRERGMPLHDEPLQFGPNRRYEIRALPFGYRFSVNAMADGYGHEYVDANTGEAMNGRIELPPMALKVADLDIRGNVVDEEGRPVPKANVLCHGRGQPQLLKVKADDQGRFVFHGICAGMAEVQANAMVDQARWFGIVKTEGGADGVEIIISPRGTMGQYTPPKPPSLVGKPLPPLADIGLDAAKDQAVLLCFFDLNQRPSRNCVTALAKRAEELKQRGIIVLAIQAAEAEGAALEQWVKDQGLAIPVGSIKTDVKKTTFAWGVRSLPWLILTDKSHVVTAEGFAAGDLDARLGNAAP
jgi:protocatechuate 3,4-dioxygenase beta subunit